MPCNNYLQLHDLLEDDDSTEEYVKYGQLINELTRRTKSSNRFSGILYLLLLYGICITACSAYLSKELHQDLC